MSRGVGLVPAVLGVVALGVLSSACAVSDLFPLSVVQCGGTESSLCQSVARLAVAQMNLDATGPVTDITLTSADCDRLARSAFLPAAQMATKCWGVEVTGERSHGGGLVLLQPDGSMEAHW